MINKSVEEPWIRVRLFLMVVLGEGAKRRQRQIIHRRDKKCIWLPCCVFGMKNVLPKIRVMDRSV